MQSDMAAANSCEASEQASKEEEVDLPRVERADLAVARPVNAAVYPGGRKHDAEVARKTSAGVGVWTNFGATDTISSPNSAPQRHIVVCTSFRPHPCSGRPIRAKFWATPFGAIFPPPPPSRAPSRHGPPKVGGLNVGQPPPPARSPASCSSRSTSTSCWRLPHGGREG